MSNFKSLLPDTRHERLQLLGAMALGAAIVVAYILFVRSDALVGDQPEYDKGAKFFADGRPYWSETPFGVPHESMWKAPGYTTWMGVLYTAVGDSPTKVELIQALLLAPLAVFLTWLLARRLFGSQVAIISAYVVAVFPLAWEFYGLLYPEALAIPLTLFAFYLFMDREPTLRLAIGLGLVLGVSLLVRPTSGFLFAGVAAAFILASGWRRGAALTALTAALALLVVAPWTIRNYIVTDGGIVPISVQDGAAYGTFNDEAASDPVYPYAWRAILQDAPEVLEGGPVDDATLRSELQEEAIDYIADHPDSVPKAFFWNGLSRYWDVRAPARALDEVPFDGRSETVTAIGLAMYYVLLPLALFGLWRLRRRKEIVIPLLFTALAASLVFTVASGTRYRAPLEPVIVVLAVAAVAGWRNRDGLKGDPAARSPGAEAPSPAR